jgi:hypothetical protein
VLHNDQHNEEQDFVDNEKQSINTAKNPDEYLYHANPHEVVKLIPTNRAEWYAQPTHWRLHETEQASSHRLESYSD